LMESMRRIDEFPELQHIFPYEEMVFKRLEPETEPTELDSHEEFVYELLENELSLGELILRARMARFCTYEALKNLLEKQLLQIIKEPKAVIEEVREEVVEEIVNKKKKLVPTMASVILLLACFAIGEYTVPAVLQPGWNAKSSAPVKVIPAVSGNLMAGSMRELSLRQLEASVCEGLEEYYAVNGSYPFTLEVLAVKKVVSEKIIENVHHSNLKYRLEKSGASYSLTRN
jgi:hypothetical protein